RPGGRGRRPGHGRPRPRGGLRREVRGRLGRGDRPQPPGLPRVDPGADADVDPVSGAPFVVVIGPPGVGKSTVAAELAARLGRTLVDTDALVEERAGAAIADIFLDRGEAAFREMESEAVLDGLRQEGIVLALGGGAPMTPAVGEALEGHRVLLLDVGIADAARRIGLNVSRPLLGVNPRRSWI